MVYVVHFYDQAKRYAKLGSIVFFKYALQEIIQRRLRYRFPFLKQWILIWNFTNGTNVYGAAVDVVKSVWGWVLVIVWQYAGVLYVLYTVDYWRGRSPNSRALADSWWLPTEASPHLHNTYGVVAYKEYFRNYGNTQLNLWLELREFPSYYNWIYWLHNGTY